MSAEINALFRLVLPPIPNLTLPPLPDITNPELERQVFTHSSYHALPRNATAFDVNDGDVILDNEKLEHIGDALLGMSSSKIGLLLGERLTRGRCGSDVSLASALSRPQTRSSYCLSIP